MVIVDVVIYLFLLFGVIYLPGRYVLRKFYTLPKELSIALLLSFAIGICQYLTAIYFLSWLKLGALYYIFAVIASVLEIPSFLKSIRRPKVDAYSLCLIGIVSFGSILMSYIMFRSGLYDANGNLPFYGVNSVDAIWHISLIENLSRHFPPTHPGISGVPLKGYNFFYDLLLSNFQKLYPFSPLDLYFRYFAVTLSILYGIAGIAIVRFLKMSKVAVALFLFLSYFAQGFDGYFLAILNIPYHSPIVQSIAHAVDPNVLLSVVFLYAGCILLFGKKPSYIAIIIFAVLPMTKIYTALLAFFGLGVVLLIALVRGQSRRYFYILIGACTLAAFMYVPINFGAGGLIFAPLLLYKHFMESGTVLPAYQWILKYQVYQEHGNVLRIVQLYAISLSLFFIPTLGIRLLSLFSIRKIFVKRFYTLPHIFLLTTVITGVAIPSLFIQSVAVFVVVQFFWIVYILLLIPTAYTIGALMGKVTLVKVGFVALVLIALFLPQTTAVVNAYSSPNPLLINKNLLNAINTISTQNKNASVLVLNEAFMNKDSSGVDAIPIISALSGRSSYYEPEVLEFYHGDLLTKNRKDTLRAIIDNLHECRDVKRSAQLLRQTKVTYILTYQQYSCLNTLPTVRKIHTSGTYGLYEVNTE